MRASLDASTVTPGSTAPDVSLTTPVIALCACTSAGSASRDHADHDVPYNCANHPTLLERNHQNRRLEELLGTSLGIRFDERKAERRANGRLVDDADNEKMKISRK